MKNITKNLVALAVALAVCPVGECLGTSAEDSLFEYGSVDLSDMVMFSDELTDNSSQTAILANYSDNAHNFGYYLDENNVEVYKKFMTLVNPSDENFTITLPEPVSFEVSSLPNSPDFSEEDMNSLRTAVFSSCKPGFDSALFDIPDIFWLDDTGIGVAIGNMTYQRNKKYNTYTCTVKSLTFSISPLDSFESVEEIAEYKTILSNAVNSFSPQGETRYEMLMNIHDRMAQDTFYSLDGKFSGSALSVLADDTGAVCEGYSKAFKLMCDTLDIPCVLVFGNYDEEKNTAHMWDYVMMEDGNWYAVDLTWDDLDGKDGLEYQHDYFLKGSESFNTNHTPEPNYGLTYLTYPELSEKDYSPVSGTVTTEPVTETAPTTSSQETPVTVIGDINRDGSINTADLILMSKVLFGLSEQTDDCDINGDSRCDVFDLTALRQIIISI